MKTSNILLLSALIIFVISLGIYNTALKAEYLTGSYKDPYKNFTTLNFKDFDQIQVNAASQIDLTVNKGPEIVRVSKSSYDYVKISQKGKTLIIDVVYNKGNHFGNELLISCPQLKSIKAYGVYTDDHKKIVQNSRYDKYARASNDLVIQGFDQDSLLIEQDNLTSIALKRNKLKLLKSIIGNTAGATPVLEINETNAIQKAELKVNQKGELHLDNIYIPQLTHQFGDSTKLTFLGAALKNLKN
jgi:hypothetical protein